MKFNPTHLLMAGASALALTTGAAKADQVFADDVIVIGSLCVGQDCVNGESFGFDTIRMKENNLRIKAQDTSNSASFPTVDWQLTFNDSSNGGANKFSIDDIDNGVTPFTIEASSIANALYVSDAGDVGLGTNVPVVELHAVDGNTPTLRLEQNGSSGFTPQTWDIAGNEANFFVRDVTNSSKLPFKIKPNAPTDSLFVAADGKIGLGTASPSADLDIVGSATQVLVGLTAGSTGWNLVMDADGQPNEGFSFTKAGTGERELRITPDGATILPTSTAAEHASVPDGAIYFDGNSMCVKISGAFVAMNNTGDTTCS